MAEKFQSKLPLLKKSINNKWKSKCIELLDDLEINLYNSALDSNTNDLLQTKLQSESSFCEIQKEIDTLQKQMSELDTKIQNKPDKRSELALYQLITKLRWDLESPENHIVGFVAGKRFQTFDMDTMKHSEQEIVDKLWAIIDPKE
ncbi:uncharacterized protein [Parasteatoda tepidariorum]|uniref:uncharacterized protein n=1 Tax=Parasteatoda tepidariorum TaxID=114398 RepID=UPI00077F8464|nr:uncharacterized protein LOC107440745 [Parasteatoda tepidariorum]